MRKLVILISTEQNKKNYTFLYDETIEKISIDDFGDLRINLIDIKNEKVLSVIRRLACFVAGHWESYQFISDEVVGV